MGTLFSLGVMVHAPSRERMKKTLDQLMLPAFESSRATNLAEAINHRRAMLGARAILSKTFVIAALTSSVQWTLVPGSSLAAFLFSVVQARCHRS